MAVVSVRKLSELGGARRIDAEYYQPSYIEFDVNLSKIPSANLGELCEKVNRNPMCYGFNYVASPGIPFFRIDDLYNPFIEKYGVVFVSDEVHHRFFSTALKTGDILMGVRGNSIGRLGIYKGEDYRANISPNLIFFRLFEPKLSNYVATVLLSRVGRIQIQRILAGTGQPTITSDLIKQIRILTVEDVIPAIDKLTKNAFEEFEKATMSYSHAEELLLEQLGLKDFKPKYELSYAANLSKAFEAHRVDAEYFQPGYEALLKRIEAFEFSKLGQIAERVLTKVKPDPAQIYKYIEISDIAVAIGETDYTERLGKELPPNARIPINGGELIISKVRPTRGAISIIPKELDTSVICSSAFSVFRTESPLKEYLYMVSRSVVGRLQMERPTTGTSYPTIDDRDIENIEIPLLPPQTQQKIASLVRESHEARRKAKELLEEAKGQVEQMIEP